ncbi:alpha-amylase family protein [Polaribacter sp.]|uniref:alpha-amylase family protein n=1 Tax=Polaribacter sp. TaxID=1920175 RepID=UPI003EF15ACC
MKRKITILIFFLISGYNYGQNFDEVADKKIKSLAKLIVKLEKQKIDAYKEKLAVNTAEIFLEFAKWDENNKAVNSELFKKVKFYKKEALKMAEELPVFERKEVILLLDESIERANQLLNNKIYRKPYTRPDWENIKISNSSLLNDDKPVFLSDYTWKPSSKRLDEYFGQLDGFFIVPTFLENKKGDMNPRILNQIENQGSKTAGFVFISHQKAPNWTAEEYGAEFNKIKGKPFTNYDIDNPGARKMISMLFEKTIPLTVGKKGTQLGYMLTNEPRFTNYKNSKKDDWFRADVSNYTLQKFEKWLENRHQTIVKLNSIWETNFKNFKEAVGIVPLDISLVGSAKWYDWTTFNKERVTDWFVYLKAELRKHNPNAKTHLKIMPSIFTDNDLDSGIDFERLTELSEINGNDVGAHYTERRHPNQDWQKKYGWYWRELYMSYDFLKSVNPNQINFNSESHLLSSEHSRDLYMNPKYARATYWAAHTLGLNATQTWYWPRKLDGSLRENLTGSFGGSNNQQPRVTFELESTLIDLNTFSEEITALQNQRKPIRIFYSQTAATQKIKYMDAIFELYEGLNFEGIPLGFATKNILSKQDKAQWDVVLVYKTERVTEEELKSVQAYLDKGGVVIIDAISLTKNEYGQPLPKLKESNGKLISLTTWNQIKENALSIIADKNQLPNITIKELNNEGGKNCTWKFISDKNGKKILSIVNLGKWDVALNIQLKNTKNKTICKDFIKGIEVTSSPVLKPFEVYFVEVLEKK